MKAFSLTLRSVPFLLLMLLLVCRSNGQDKPSANVAELAKKLSNPVASLISVPFQNNTDVGIGSFNGSRNTLNFQPVVPFKLGNKLNLITRYVVPVISQHDITAEGEKQSGLSDATVSAFFAPHSNSITWGIGPAFLLPIATNDYLGSKKWGVGPTLIALKQKNGWTFGALLNQLWSVAGDENRSDINQMFLQPFLVHNWKSGAGLGINAEMTFNWEANTTAIFFNPFLSGVTRLGTQTVSLSVGPRICLASPAASRADFGIRGALTFVFPQ